MLSSTTSPLLLRVLTDANPAAGVALLLNLLREEVLTPDLPAGGERNVREHLVLWLSSAAPWAAANQRILGQELALRLVHMPAAQLETLFPGAAVLLTADLHVPDRPPGQGAWPTGPWLLYWLEQQLPNRNKRAPETPPDLSKLDAGLAQHLPTLMRAWPEQRITQLLALALQLPLPTVADRLWSIERVSALDQEGQPVLQHAKTAADWTRFLAQGGDPFAMVLDRRGLPVPFWMQVLANPGQASAKSTTLTGAIERWAWAQAPLEDGRGRGWLTSNLKTRAGHPLSLTLPEWKMLLPRALPATPAQDRRKRLVKIAEKCPGVAVLVLHDPCFVDTRALLTPEDISAVVHALAAAARSVREHRSAVGATQSSNSTPAALGAAESLSQVSGLLNCAPEWADEAALMLAWHHPTWTLQGASALLDTKYTLLSADGRAALHALPEAVYWGKTGKVGCLLELLNSRPRSGHSKDSKRAWSQHLHEACARLEASGEAMDGALAALLGLVASERRLTSLVGPLRVLRTELDPERYARVVSGLEALKKEHGSTAFGQFLRQSLAEVALEEALPSAPEGKRPRL